MSAAYLEDADAPDAQLCSAGYQVQPCILGCPLQTSPLWRCFLMTRCSSGKTSGSALSDRSLMHALCAGQVHAFRERVQFTSAAAGIPAGTVLLEVGPHGVLRSPLRQCRPELPYTTAMQRDADAAATVPAAVCELWRKGASFEWPAPPSKAAAAEAERARLALSWRLSTPP